MSQPEILAGKTWGNDYKIMYGFTVSGGDYITDVIEARLPSRMTIAAAKSLDYFKGMSKPVMTNCDLHLAPNLSLPA